MKKVFLCCITCSNADGKSYKSEFDCESRNDVGRAIITFKPKREYFVTGITSFLEMRLV